MFPANNVSESPRLMAPEAAAKALLAKLGSRESDPRRPRTVADASAESGLPLRDAEAGLTFLTAEYRGHLRVTEDGDLLYVFPDGFTKPWETKEKWQRLVGMVGHALLGAGRFIIRAWLLIAMVGYALLFVALFIALSTAGNNNRRDDRGGILGLLFRAIADAIFWTARPFSPVYAYPYMASSDGFSGTRRPARAAAQQGEDVPFYERVNRFVFGPKEPDPDPLAMRAQILSEIRADKGRIGLSDVMRVTGLPRDQADPLMARLMLDHEGSVEVSEAGGIYYVFPEMRRTAMASELPFPPPRARAAWETKKALPPLTGNEPKHDLMVGALNAFNLLASGWVLANGLTIANVLLLLSKKPPPVLPYDGVPVALGIVPLVFSIVIFLLPALRALQHKVSERGVKKENARLQIMKEVLTRAPKKEPVSDETLRSAVRIATGYEPTSKDITRQVVALGGDVSPGPDGEIRYRFADIEAEAEALEEERAHVPEKEARLGRVVFASDD